jgi:hypothetical protein
VDGVVYANDSTVFAFLVIGYIPTLEEKLVSFDHINQTLMKGLVSLYENQKNLAGRTSQIHPRKSEQMKGLLGWLKSHKAESERAQEVDKGYGRLDRKFYNSNHIR